jgi:mannan endo-1,4-beta-mannosidase
MNHLPKTFLLLVCLIMSAVAGQAATTGQGQYVGVRNGQFYVEGKPYRYVGTNLWYAAILASDGEGGNRQRLGQELDCLQQLGIDNLRILVGADGRLGVPSHVRPV